MKVRTWYECFWRDPPSSHAHSTQSNLLLPTSSLLVFVFLVLWTLFFFSLRSKLSVNLWSVQYLNNVFDPALTNGGLPLAPKSHPTSDLWMAKLALNEGRYGDVVATTRSAVQSGNLLAGRLAGQAYLAQGDFLDAVKTWSVVYDAESLLSAGRTAQDQNQVEEALLAYSAANRIAPEKTALLLANLLHARARTGDAISVLHDALIQNPKSYMRARWLDRLAALYLHRSDWQNLQEVVAQLHADSPKDIQPYIYAGWIFYYRDHDSLAAFKQFQRAVELTPNDARSYDAMAWLFYREKDYRQAIFYSERAVSLVPLNNYYQLIRANSYRDASELTHSISLYGELISRYPNWSPAYYEQAWAYRLNSQPNQAVDSIYKALLLMESPNQDYYLRDGMILEWAGQAKEAVAVYELLLKLNPNHKQAAAAIQRLK